MFRSVGPMASMLSQVPIRETIVFEEYKHDSQLLMPAEELEQEAKGLAGAFKGRRVLMVNSTAQGGGVAEMLPRLICLLRHFGVDAQWWVTETDQQPFFDFTKKLHNLIHGAGTPSISGGERQVYETVNQQFAAAMDGIVRPGDILVIHDPQPMALVKYLKKRDSVLPVWRCHIGLDIHNEQTHQAWTFLEDYAQPYSQAVFTAAEYIPSYFAHRATMIYPAIDPLSHKNRQLPIIKVGGILRSAGLIQSEHPAIAPNFKETVLRAQSDGSLGPALASDLGFFHRPMVTQVSRWDRLKGFGPLMDGFVHLKKSPSARLTERQAARIKAVRLLMVGPDPKSVADDPEGQGVLDELLARYAELDKRVQEDIGILCIPMTSAKENALIVNAIQRSSSVIVQNSLREGFGLTATEAMWKGIPVLASDACGLRQQIRDGIDGIMHYDPENPTSVADALGSMLHQPKQRMRWGNNAQLRATREFLSLSQTARWLRLLAKVVRRAR